MRTPYAIGWPKQKKASERKREGGRKEGRGGGGRRREEEGGKEGRKERREEGRKEEGRKEERKEDTFNLNRDKLKIHIPCQPYKKKAIVFILTLDKSRFPSKEYFQE